ncbi:MAG TPA: hypothetical protein VN519_06365 [Bryobacteraceae bacterium]|nr:hypothetical protein [Bryobacteraceae bacterium]
MALKAYVAFTDYGEHQEIVFAKRGQDVKRIGLDVWSDCDFVERRVKRAPGFDDASDPPTAREFLDRGWFLYCTECGGNVYGDTEGHITVGQRAFCGPDCLKRFARECAEYKWSFPEIAEAVAKL